MKDQDRMIMEQLEGRDISDQRVLKAFQKVPRGEFVPEYQKEHAYADRPLPIGEGQTISQPYIVAKMTELLELKGDEKVLEIGAGSGYQAAILCELAGKVVTIERHPELAEKAGKLLARLGYDNFEIIQGDGTRGYEKEAPYDAIIVTAAAPDVPQPLKEQLKQGGVMVIPVGSRHEQQLIQIKKTEDGFTSKPVLDCMFVPLVGEHGWD